MGSLFPGPFSRTEPFRGCANSTKIVAFLPCTNPPSYPWLYIMQGIIHHHLMKAVFTDKLLGKRIAEKG